MPTQAFTKRRTVLPIKLGLRSTTIADAAPVTSNTFSVDGYNQVTVHFNLAWVAATAVSAYLETSPDKGTNWFRSQTKAILSGVETMSDRSQNKAVTASKKWTWEFGGVNSDWARLVVTGTGGTTDAITATVELGVV